MSNYVLEGDSYLVLEKFSELTKEKRISFEQNSKNSFSLFDDTDFNVLFELSKDSVVVDPFIVCIFDKNLDHRLDFVKKLKQRAEFICFDPIPTTDFKSLRALFPNMPKTPNLPSKNMPLKYKGSKQNYEWYDLALINDIYKMDNMSLFKEIFSGFFDIWAFSDALWDCDESCLSMIQYINDDNFEDYFNRIRETSKDYIEVIQTGAKTLQQHRKLNPKTAITNDFRFLKTKEKLDKIKKPQINAVMLFDECLKNVRTGSNPKLELVNLFRGIKQYAK